MQKSWTVAVAAALMLSGAAIAAEPVTNPEEAVALYDAGRYAEAQVMLEALDAEDRTTGPLLYRLAFALGQTGDASAGTAMANRAHTVLQQEFAAGGGVEVAFYLSNSYRNRNDRVRSVQVALAVCKRLESGDLPLPETAPNRFRVGKLYADQDREDEAAGWYRQALEGFEKQTGRFPSYESWIRSYLGRLASDHEDWETAGDLLRANLSDDRGSYADYDLLAVLLSRSGRWDEAGESWRTLEGMDPARANRPRYCRQLTIRAREVDPLPLETLDGEPIAGLDKDRMETILKELAGRVMAARANAGTDPETDMEAAHKILAEVKPVFVAVALEYAYQGHPIRETAFQGGYAPLIFHAARWEIGKP